ncbi:MAG: hypothetical protein V9H26_02100 [Verrucomicrobiota bacterium]
MKTEAILLKTGTLPVGKMWQHCRRIFQRSCAMTVVLTALVDPG